MCLKRPRKKKEKKDPLTKKNTALILSKADQIFNILLRDKQIVPKDDHKIPFPE